MSSDHTSELEAEVERLTIDLTECSHRLRQQIDRAKAAEALSRTGAVKVKALVWASVYGYAARAASPVEIYAITEYAGMAEPFKLEGIGHSSLYFSDLAAAKAAAQTDYERRILAALEPAAPEVNEAADDNVDAAYQAALDSLPAEFHGEIGRGELDCMVRAIINAHDSKWERRAKTMAHHHQSALQASIVASKPTPPEGKQEPVAWQEPELTCPHIERAVTSGELSPAVVDELASIREINSQLRYGTWALKAQLAALTRPSEQAVTEDWQPIDTAPHGVQVLLYTPPFACMGADAKHEMRVGCASWGEVIGGISNRSFDGHATYWRPLPNPPSALKAAMEAGRHD